MRKKMEPSQKRLHEIDRLIDELNNAGSVKTDHIVIHPETAKALLEDTIKTLESKGIKIFKSEFVPVDEIYYVGKNPSAEELQPAEVFGNFMPYVTVPKPLFMDREPEVKSKLKTLLSKSNINDIKNTDDGTVTFTLSFYKKKDCYHLYEFYDKKGFKHAITIHMTKPYKDSFGFTYYDLEVRHQADAGGPIEVIDKIKIPDSYKKWCDCVAYMHGIYRDEKDSCYKVIVVFGHSKALFGEKIILK